VSTVRCCALAQFTRAAWYRKSAARDQSALALRIRDIAHVRPRFGFERITVMLRREEWLVNRKRVRRLYRLQGLQLRMRVRRRKHMCLHRGRRRSQHVIMSVGAWISYTMRCLMDARSEY
jgi:putative transposase